MRALPILLGMLLAVPALAGEIEGETVRYVGGSLPSLQEGTLGRLNLTSEEVLVFEHGGGKAEIPYKNIRYMRYSTPLARNLGALPTIVVGLLKRQKRKHILEIAYEVEGGAQNAAVFEVSKKRARSVNAVLNARAPRPCPIARPGQPAGAPSAPVPCRALWPLLPDAVPRYPVLQRPS
jgi:hypothetical protein